ncbi:peptidoglycan-binding protein [Streptomyces bottropensis]|uniref:Peptidoglycan-binding protein n=1 Tax=Streptomyces bottropensis TaxID=42235 RepID=A0ABU8ADS5_9ACTN|nr:peptidoglycan-binding protein [Streptomyces bottropensis]MZD18655.1 peptidoglycan-binding protein [Streptomyces sp. SID5476]
MSEPTAPACPRCGTPRATDGTPACSCGRLASEAHRDIRTAQAEAAEDFDPVRIRPFVKVGEDEPRQGATAADDTPARTTEPPHAPTTPTEPHHASAAEEEPPVDPARGERRRRRALPAAVVGAAAAAVLVTAGTIGGLFSYEAPSRDGSGPGDIRADLPEAAAGAVPSSSAPPSPTVSSASPSASSSTSPEATPTESPATPTRSGTPSRTPSDSDATATGVPAPTASAGKPPVLGLGDQGAEVTELQLRLGQLGLYDGEADGDYDRDVQSAVRGYQLTRVLLEDESGVYGETTRAALESETSEP